MDRNEIKTAFTKTVNIIEPEHPYRENLYPVSKSNIRFGYRKKTGPYYASCGPIRRGSNEILFDFDYSYFQQVDTVRVVAIFLHELTHIPIGKHSTVEYGGHPPRFWRELGFHTHKAIDNLEELNSIFGDFTPEELVGKVIRKEVTGFNVDKRYADPIDYKQEFAQWFNSTLR